MAPKGLSYSKEHEWVALDGEIATIGITDYAQNSLGDIVYVELPSVGRRLAQFETIGVLESVKTVSDLYTPLGGVVTEINAALEADPALVNRDAFGGGWLFRIRPNDPGERERLLDADAYDAFALAGSA